jgi:hypothetical protein
VAEVGPRIAAHERFEGAATRSVSVEVVRGQLVAALTAGLPARVVQALPLIDPEPPAVWGRMPTGELSGGLGRMHVAILQTPGLLAKVAGRFSLRGILHQPPTSLSRTQTVAPGGRSR